MHVYFCSQQWSELSVSFACIFFCLDINLSDVLLYHRYNIMFYVDPIYFNYSSALKKTCIVSV